MIPCMLLFMYSLSQIEKEDIVVLFCIGFSTFESPPQGMLIKRRLFINFFLSVLDISEIFVTT